jgi:hypothetical protein
MVCPFILEIVPTQVAQLLQNGVQGSTSSRASPIGSPHRAQMP